MTIPRQRLGLIFRLLGPAIEGLSLVALVRYGRQGRTWLGRPLEHFLYAGLALGLVLVVVGLVLSQFPGRRRDEEL
ncbi:hypothetical protein TA3x_001426 [Tundrisphaera sp. TA3]|uniref:hypothetical protein n=1 Tax=Tundrisphaera sp. TA3 TaxID=3435775 RepID=UPI003EBE6EE4